MGEVFLTAVDNSREIELVEGDRVTIRLDENLSTGYAWEWGSLDEGLFDLISNEHRQDSPGIGRGGTREVILKAVRRGQGQLCLRLRRSWDPPNTEADRFEVRVSIG
ncbi:MAG: protease inhibitor I42 family protein [Acidobacteriota bacterium]